MNQKDVYRLKIKPTCRQTGATLNLRLGYIPLHPGHTELPASWGPETRRSPAAAPGSSPRSWFRPRFSAADCGGSHVESG